MHILFISIAWPSPGEKNLYTDLMDVFVLRGHRVHVVGNQEKNKQSPTSCTVEKGITVLRVSTGKIRKTSYLKKATTLMTLGAKMRKAIQAHFAHEHFDLMVAPTPSITLSVLYKRLKRTYQMPFYLLLKDIWPQGSVDLKVFKKYSIPWLYFRMHEKRLYKVADYIGTMSPLGAKYLLSKNGFLPEHKVEVCPNSIRPMEQSPAPGHHAIRDKYGIPRDACVFIFSGNLGIGHGLHFLVEALKALSDYPGAYFVLGGSGTHYHYLEEKIAAMSSNNVFLYSWLPREDFEQILASSDVGLVFLYRYTSPQFPSRLLSYFEYSRPVLCAVNQETDIGSIVEEEACGLSVDHGNLDAFVKAVKYLSEHGEERESWGRNGRELLMERYTVSQSYEIIMNHFNRQPADQ